jgi:ankyrin repeat protein
MSQMFTCVDTNNFSDALLILEEGVNVNVESLHELVMSGHIDLLKALLTRGANVNITDRENYTPITLGMCK